MLVLCALVVVVAFAWLFFCVEMAAVQHGKDSWEWAKRLYAKHEWIQTVKW